MRLVENWKMYNCEDYETESEKSSCCKIVWAISKKFVHDFIFSICVVYINESFILINSLNLNKP